PPTPSLFPYTTLFRSGVLAVGGDQPGPLGPLRRGELGAGGERLGRTTALSRVYARAVPGRVLEHTFDAGANTLRLRYAARGTAPLELFVPARRFPGGFALRCDGK